MTGTCPSCGKQVAVMETEDSLGLVKPHRSARNPSRLGGCEGAGKLAVGFGGSAAKERVWRALDKAAERIGMAAYKAGHYKVKRRRGKVVQGYTLSEAHLRVLETMNALGRDEITPEEAMAVLHEYDVLKARVR